MYSWFSTIGSSIIHIIAPFALIIVALIVEKQFVSRATVFANAIAINLFFYSIEVPDLLGWYLNVALIWGGIGILARWSNTSLGQWYYKPGWLFSSIAVGIIMLYFIANPLPTTLVTALNTTTP